MAIYQIRQLTRSRSGVVAGVCSGLAQFFGMNLVFVRLTFLVLTLFYGIGIIIYLLLVVIIPLDPPLPVGALEPPTTRPVPPAKRTLVGYITALVTMTGTIATLLTNISTIEGFFWPERGYPPLVATEIVYRPAPSPTNQPVPSPTNQPAPSPTNQPASNSLNGTYVFNQLADSDPYTRVTNIVVSDSATEITINVTNGSATDPYQFNLYPPGTPNAFVILTPDFSQYLPLRFIEGVATWPDYELLNPGETREFTLTFDRIPDSLTTFHLSEGIVDNPDMTEWVFLNVQLR